MLISKIYRQSGPEAVLVILAHGRAGNVDVMQAFKPVLPEDAIIVAVQAPYQDPEGGYRWWNFRAGHEFSDGSPEGAPEAAAVFLDWLNQFISDNSLRPKAILAIGFSQGAALLSYVIQIRPDIFKGVALLAGFVVQAQQNKLNDKPEPYHKSAVFVAHGKSDTIVPVDVAGRGVEFLNSLGFTVQFITEDVGHKIGVNSMKSLKSWISSFF